MVQEGPALLTPAAAPAEAVLGVAETRPVSEKGYQLLPKPGGCWTQWDGH